VTLEAVNANDGSSLAKEQVEADSKEHVLASLGKAATSLREKLGESLTSLKKFDAPVEQATTSSLDALKDYTQGTEIFQQGDNAGAIPWFKRAIEIDPNFAMAYGRLAVIYNNSFQSDLGEQYSQKAYDLRNRVSEHERFYLEEKYAAYVTGDREEAVKVLKSWTQTYPNDFIPHNNLCVNYALAGKWEDSMAEAKEAVRLSPNNVVPKTNLIEGYIRTNRFDEAQQSLDQLLGDNTERGSYKFYASIIAFAKGDVDAANKALEFFAKSPNEPDLTDAQSNMAGFAGQWKKALALSARSYEIDVRTDRKENAAQIDGANAFLESQFGLCDQAKPSAERALSVYKARSTLGLAALALAACGDPRGIAITDDLQKRYPKDTPINFFIAPMVKALVESNKGNSSAAIDALQPAMNFEFGNIPGLWLNYVRANIFLRGKMGNEAATEFRKILDHRGVEPASPFYNLAHLGLARALMLTGDAASARTEYQNFFAAWKDADPDLPILVDAKKEYEQIK
jgi:tetratricopeptide (TPR) repeat protein